MRKIPFLLFLVMTLVLSACGAAKPTTTINVTMTDFQFQPADFIIPAGQEITVNAANNGAVLHNFVIMKLGTTVGEMFDNADVPNIYWEIELQPGGETSVTFTAPTELGEYQLVCRTAGHIASGMTGTITVAAGE
jgi:plastocyanin